MVKYASVGDASESIKRLGRGCFMAKTDVKSAFRIIPMQPADYSLLGLKWETTGGPSSRLEKKPTMLSTRCLIG